MIVGAAVIAIYVIYHLRHRDVTKYRDLLVIVVLVELLTIGLQVRDLENAQSRNTNTKAVVTLLNSIAKTKHMTPKRLAANATSVYSGMLVQVDRQATKTYAVILDTDGQSYQLKATHLIQAKSTYVQ
jgi:hypothetical protein